MLLAFIFLKMFEHSDKHTKVGYFISHLTHFDCLFVCVNVKCLFAGNDILILMTLSKGKRREAERTVRSFFLLHSQQFWMKRVPSLKPKFGGYIIELACRPTDNNNGTTHSTQQKIKKKEKVFSFDGRGDVST